MEGLPTPVTETKKMASISGGARPACERARHRDSRPSSSAAFIQARLKSPNVCILK
jgi:hypothetical protein